MITINNKQKNMVEVNNGEQKDQDEEATRASTSVDVDYREAFWDVQLVNQYTFLAVDTNCHEETVIRITRLALAYGWKLSNRKKHISDPVDGWMLFDREETDMMTGIGNQTQCRVYLLQFHSVEGHKHLLARVRLGLQLACQAEKHHLEDYLCQADDDVTDTPF